MALKTILIDDERNNNESLKFMLEKFCPVVSVTGIAEDSIAGEKLIRETNPDLVFLDIEMPFGNGFDLLNKLRPVNFAVVFVTAFDSYALEAIKYSALDYLLKPVNIGELKMAVEKTAKQKELKDQNERINNLLFNFSAMIPGSKKIGLTTQDGILFEKLENIIYLMATSNYTIVYTTGKQKHTVTKTLKDFEEMLPPSIFCRVHHSYIINTEFIKKYTRGRGGYVEMEDGTVIEVSARKKDEFLARFG